MVNKRRESYYHKYYIVSRRKNGKVISRRRWSPKRRLKIVSRKPLRHTKSKISNTSGFKRTQRQARPIKFTLSKSKKISNASRNKSSLRKGISIKREIINKKAFVVVRKNGKIQEKQKFTTKTSIESLKRKFKQDNTLKKGVEIEQLKNLKEVRSSNLNIKPTQKHKFRVKAGVELVNGERIGASSDHKFWHRIADAVYEAQQRLFMRIHQAVAGFGNYDAGDGEKIFDRVASSDIDFQVVHYTE